MRTLFIITLLLTFVAVASIDNDMNDLYSTWAPWFSKEVGLVVDEKSTMTSKRRKGTEEKPKEISVKKVKKVVEAKDTAGGK